MKPKVIVSAGAGFIGSQVVAAAVRAGLDTRWITRRPDHSSPQAFLADLNDPIRVQAALHDRDILIHCASRTDGTEEAMWRDNVEATRQLLRAAHNSGVRRVIYVSTTGVYGRSYGEFGNPGDLIRVPRSPLSRARIAAEDSVLAAGGSVIRPHLILGAADRWVRPPLLRFMQHYNAWIGGQDVKVAAIDVVDLSEALVRVAVSERLPSVLHAAAHDQLPIAAIAAPHFARRNLPLPTRVMSVAEVASELQPFGVSPNAVMMLGRSSAMRSEPFWRAAAEGDKLLQASDSAPRVA